VPTSIEVQELWERIADAVSKSLADLPLDMKTMAQLLAALVGVTSATAARIGASREMLLDLVKEVYGTTKVAIPVENLLRAMESAEGKTPSPTKFRSASQLLDDAKLEEVLAEWRKGS
jgi:hypothetical protein